MKHRILLIGAALALATSIAAAQTQQSQPPPPPPEQAQPPQTPPKTEDITLTGCVVQGSAPSVFLFENARVNPANKEEKARSYVLIVGAEDLAFRPHLNHQVMLVGKGEIKLLPTLKPGEKYKEADLPRFTATKVTEVSPTCQ
jgi:glucose/arabinose dehydrogenase